MNSWERVASAGDVKAGDIIQVEVAGEPVVLANTGSEFLAVGDVCSHDYVLLHEGWLEGDTIECPQHGSKFNMRSGAVLNPPATKPVAPYEVKVEGHDVYARPMEKAND
ncbi:MAG: non-heme iron oxygenase ferredoxin subunit [Actinomycetota bacterium]